MQGKGKVMYIEDEKVIKSSDPRDVSIKTDYRIMYIGDTIPQRKGVYQVRCYVRDYSIIADHGVKILLIFENRDKDLITRKKYNWEKIFNRIQ